MHVNSAATLLLDRTGDDGVGVDDDCGGGVGMVAVMGPGINHVRALPVRDDCVSALGPHHSVLPRSALHFPCLLANQPFSLVLVVVTVDQLEMMGQVVQARVEEKLLAPPPALPR